MIVKKKNSLNHIMSDMTIYPPINNIANCDTVRKSVFTK